MRILFLTAGSKHLASSRIRVYQYLPYLRLRWISWSVIQWDSERHTKAAINLSKSLGKRDIALKRFCHGLKIIKLMLLAPFYNIIFIQKVLLPIWVQRIIRILNDKIVFDFDDAIYYTGYASGKTKEGSGNESMAKRRFAHTIEISKCVILTNRYTKEYAQQYNTNTNMVTITGPIDADRYFPKPKVGSDKIVIGWIGSPATTPYINLLDGPLKSLSKRYPNVTIELIGASPIAIEGVRIKVKEWRLDTEVEHLQNFDIGIMPLPDDEWTQGKGGYKLLQYMAVGIPCVASPVGINQEIISDGINGYLARSDGDWEEKLSILVENRELRRSMGKKGRQIAVAKYSFKAYTPILVDCLQKLVRNS